MIVKLPTTNQFNTKKSIGLSLRANFSWTFIGNVFYAGTQWGLIVLLTKLFDPTTFGQYALAFSIVTPIFTASGLQLRNVQVSAVEDANNFADYFLLRLITSILALLVLVLLSVLQIFPAHLFFLIILLGCNQIVVLIKDLYQGLMQKQERMDLASSSQILQGGMTLIAATVLAFITPNIYLVVIGLLIARILTLLLYDIPRAQAVVIDSKPLITRDTLRQAANLSRIFSLSKAAFPLGLVSLLITMHGNLPQYFLAGSGEAAVGFFAAMVAMMRPQQLVVGALGLSSVRRLSLYYATDRKRYIGLLGQLVTIGVSLGIGSVIVALIFGRVILTTLYRAEYGGFVNVFVWLMAANLILNAQSFIGYGLTAARMFKVQVWIYGFMLLSMFISAWVLIPTWAGLGAAWAMFISATITLIAGFTAIVVGLKTREDYHCDNTH